ncbi:hypothetical protein ACU610_01995 [Geodermatophilus sp. URMC 61]|uniref:hypothetical protein n=1 Tax=Geodermatophilus sp. URMC 61 TaxID=3423411 RepID=UPI00406C36CC
MLKEVAVERYCFTCAGCGHTWNTDYDVQHVEDGHGLTWEYYSLNGIPVPSPTARGALSCPRCGATWIHFELVAVRNVPLVEPADGQAEPARPRQRLDAERQAVRGRAALLRGDRPATEGPVRGGPSGVEP